MTDSTPTSPSILQRTGSHMRPAWGLYLLLLRFSAISWISTLFYGLILPMLSYAIFSADAGADVRRRMLLGNVLFSAVMIFLRMPSVDSVFHREMGYFDLLATTGATKTTYLLARGIEVLTLSFMPLSVLLFGLIAGGLGQPASMLWLLPVGLGILTFMGSALVIAAVSPNIPTAGLLANLAIMACLCFCPLVYPLERVPAIVLPLVRFLPPTLTIEGFESAWVSGAAPLWQLGTLALWAVLLGTFGWRRFRWTEPA